MTIVEYTLEGGRIPSFVTSGGYWMNNDNDKMIGVGLEGNIPDGITTYNLEELQTRQLAIHAKYPLDKQPMSAEIMTDDEVNDTIKAWWDARS